MVTNNEIWAGDLHGLSMLPAFILSQDQTLRKDCARSKTLLTKIKKKNCPTRPCTGFVRQDARTIPYHKGRALPLLAVKEQLFQK